MMEREVTLGLIQRKSSPEPEDNVRETFERIREAADKGVQIVLLQEFFNTAYFAQEMDEKYFDWAEPIPGELTDRVCELAKELEVVIVAPFFEKRAPGLYHNSAVVIDADGTMMGRYRKQHIPDDPGFNEKFYFTEGDGGYKVFDTRYAKISPLICWDQWYPEAARICSLKGAEILVFPTAIGTLPHEMGPEREQFLNAWKNVQVSHSIANGVFVASINRVGEEKGNGFWGHSFVAGPFGQMLAEAGTEDELLITTVDLHKIEKQRRVWPFFRDRRIDTYEPILKRYID